MVRNLTECQPNEERLKEFLSFCKGLGVDDPSPWPLSQATVLLLCWFPPMMTHGQKPADSGQMGLSLGC